ncbi:MAG: asparagine synthase (glutamine-hydrolyzing) [Deltaproteobacteria bacterium]|nr:asparagine synthase (glutamine-hydrolyzing) [Deltaproteobacteria bacterium]
MCGLAGLVELEGRPVDRGLLSRMTSSLAHRGPDGEGFFVDDSEGRGLSCGLGHRRLSIIDLSPVRHPLANEDGTIQVMVNGEFYGYQAVRAELEKKGHHFATNCDSEILAHLYEEEGDQALRRLRGMFALALWDGPRRRLLLARDRLGQKPLYWTRQGSRFLFASEVKAFFQNPDFERRLNREALGRYLTWLYLPGRGSMVQGVFRLRPGHLAVIDASGLKEKPYWSLNWAPEKMDRAQAEDGFLALLKEAVSLRLVSDAPLGAFLSGGLDSSIICALMAELGGRPRTFTVRFGQATFDESAKARRVAGALGTDHTEVAIEPDVMADLEALIHYLDEPMADSSAIPTFWLSRATKQHVTVALSGDGGDELLAGYRRYVGRRLAGRYNRLPGSLRKLGRLAAGALPESSAYTGRSLTKKLKGFLQQADQVAARPDSSRIDFLTQAELEGLLGPVRPPAGPDLFRTLFEAAPDSDPVARMQWVDLQTYLPDDILVKVDRMAMAHALEVRSPFLDHRLVEFLARVPVSLKLKGLTTKYLLKRVAARYLDQETINQPKQGFEVLLAAWFRGRLRGLVQETLGRSQLERAGLLRPGAAGRLLAEHLTGRRDRAQVLWGLLVLELWLKKFKVGLS